MQRSSTIALAALFLLVQAAAAEAGGARGDGRAVRARRPGATNAPVFRDLDRSVKSAATGTPLSRAFRVPRGNRKTSKPTGGYTVKAEDATLIERPKSGGRAVIQLEQSPHGRAVKSTTLRVPSRTRRGSELLVRNADGYMEVSVRDPERGEVWARLSLGPKAPAEVAVTYYILPPGEHMRTRPPVSPADASAFFEAMGGFHPARGTRAGRAVADFTRRLKATAAELRPEEQARIAPLIQLLTPASTGAPSLAPERTARARSRTAAARGRTASALRPQHPNAPLFAEARRSLRLAAQGTPLARQERVAARPGERAYTLDARKATLSQDGEHGRSSLHIENTWGQRFRPRGARVSVPGTGARGARLDLAYTPHKIRVELVDQRRGTLEIALDNDVDTPAGIRYSVVDIAGSGTSEAVSPAEALRFVRDVGGFQPAPGTRATIAVSDLARRLESAARGMTPGQRAELAPLIAALGGAR